MAGVWSLKKDIESITEKELASLSTNIKSELVELIKEEALKTLFNTNLIISREGTKASMHITIDQNVYGRVMSKVRARLPEFISSDDASDLKKAFEELKILALPVVLKATTLLVDKVKRTTKRKDMLEEVISTSNIKNGISEEIINTLKAGKSSTSKTKVVIPLVIKLPALRNLKGHFTSTTNIMALMQQMLHDTIKKNMQRPNLHYQSGRFAKSVKVEGISRARDGALTAFLSYMRYPYGTFEAGGKQGHKGYYPSRLINESAREIATKLTRERFTSITIK